MVKLGGGTFHFEPRQCTHPLPTPRRWSMNFKTKDLQIAQFVIGLEKRRLEQESCETVTWFEVWASSIPYISDRVVPGNKVGRNAGS
jgi:hypothetical protein